MALSNEQFTAIIGGIRSICDGLLNIVPAAPLIIGDAVATEVPPATTQPALKIVENPATPPTGAATIPPAAPAPGVAPATIPPAGVAPATGPAPVELDTEGIPWDERIHTAKKSKLKSGVWRLKPGADPVLVAQVKTELTFAAQAVTTPPAGVAPGTPPAAVVGVEPMSWSDLLNRIVDAKKTPEEVLAACTACGVENIGKLQDVPLLIPNVATVLGV